MIELKNVSKFYYSKGVIAAGFSKINLKLKAGEFVAITGESGSGKSTLLNVISGLDSYEEGEMYIDGKETSHYIEKDWEEYRRKNIGNIYQNFNLINSYTVYQNIDLALSLNGVNNKERKQKIISLLKKVDMYKYKNTKVSKLSGGQKQRVAIARALAKDIPVIIADEPTGSLDKKSAINIIKILKEVSQDKLVIIVTHNYDQVSEYVTRKITMHDGRVIEDIKVKPPQEDVERTEQIYKNIKFFDKLKLGFRNTFNIIPKFILLFLVYSFIVCALMGEYSFFKKSEYESSKNGLNYVYRDTNDHRIIINKKDKTQFTEEEIKNIKKMNNINYVMENDAVVDKTISFTTENENFWFSGRVVSKELFEGKVDFGRMPQESNEIIIEGNPDDYYLSNSKEEIIKETLYMSDYNGNMKKDKSYKIVGIKYSNNDLLVYSEYKFYVGEEILSDLQFDTHQLYSEITIDFMGKNHKSDNYTNDFKLETNNYVPKNEAYISEDYNLYCEKYNCINKTFNIKIKNNYYEDNITLTIKKTYSKKNINSILDFPNYNKEKYEEIYNGKIYINKEDYNYLFEKNTYQMSVYVDEIESIDETIKQLNNFGYNTLKIKDTLVSEKLLEVVKVFKLVVTIILVVVLFFISYFIIKIILKSRNSYFSILRMLGASKKVCKQLLMIELFFVSNLSYFIFTFIAELNKRNVFDIKFINVINTYFKFNDYLVLYILIVSISILISLRYSRKLFKESVMNTYRDGGTV